MPMDGLTLSFVTREMEAALSGGRVDKITQPERDELNILVRNHGRNWTLLLSASAGCARAHITQEKKVSPLEPPMLCMLLRKHILGGRVRAVRQIRGDRIVEIEFEHLDEMGDSARKTLVCEFMGRHSNLIFVDAQGRILECARRVTQNMSSVREVLPGLRYERPPEHGKTPFDAPEEEIERALRGASGPLHKAVAGAISGLSVQTAREIAFRAAGNEDAHTQEMDMAAVAPAVARALAGVRMETAPALLFADSGEPVDVVAFPYLSRAALRSERFETVSEAMDAFYRARDRAERIQQKSAALHRVLKNNIERCERKLALQKEALLGSERMEEYRVKGELLTASLHLAKKGMKSVNIPNYYEEGAPEIEVQLDEKLSPGQNAQRYFKLYQKARSAKRLAAEQVEKTTEELSYLEGQMLNLSACVEENDLAELREELEKYGYVRKNHNRRQMKQLEPSRPMRFDSPTGIPILVGKNNLQNDKLTFTAEPNEWWLHAKDMPGSHVIVASADPDEETLHMAARLAARYSKGASAGKVPVDMTRRRYVKKPAGAKPGFVLYTNQKTVLAEPWEG
ncbi:MAG TPA: NFACT family protein [Candidatus Pullichristensenella avicola]|nr:NFACT family protein [Candidatus Pullichristensenella avicola]